MALTKLLAYIFHHVSFDNLINDVGSVRVVEYHGETLTARPQRSARDVHTRPSSTVPCSCNQPHPL